MDEPAGLPWAGIQSSQRREPLRAQAGHVEGDGVAAAKIVQKPAVDLVGTQIGLDSQ